MKIWNYIVFFTAMILFLEFVGVPTGLSATMDYFGVEFNPTTSELITADVLNSNFYAFLFGAGGLLIALGLGAAIVVGLITRQFDMNLALIPLSTTVLVLFASTGWTIVRYVQSLGQGWLTALIATIFVPLSIAYLFAIVEFIRGTD